MVNPVRNKLTSKILRVSCFILSYESIWHRKIESNDQCLRDRFKGGWVYQFPHSGIFSSVCAVKPKGRAMHYYSYALLSCFMRSANVNSRVLTITNMSLTSRNRRLALTFATLFNLRVVTTDCREHSSHSLKDFVLGQPLLIKLVRSLRIELSMRLSQSRVLTTTLSPD